MDTLQHMRLLDIVHVRTVQKPKRHEMYVEHKKHFGFSLCIEGSITYTFNGKNYTSDTNHAVILPQGQNYYVHSEKGCQLMSVNFNCTDFSNENFLVIPLTNAAACATVFSRLQEDMMFGRSQFTLMRHFYELLELLCSNIGKDDTVFSATLRYLESHLSDPTLSNQRLAQQAGFSEAHFRRLFTKRYGIPPRQYLLELRIRKAKQLLCEGVAITAVSEACGFDGLFHFSRFFKKRTGLSPTAYARMSRDQII